MAISFWRHSNKIRNQTGVRSQSTWALCFWLKQKVHEKWKLKVVAQAKSDLLIATSCCCPLCFFFVCVSYLLSGKQLTAQQPHIKGWLNCQRLVDLGSWIHAFSKWCSYSSFDLYTFFFSLALVIHKCCASLFKNKRAREKFVWELYEFYLF